MSIEEAAAAAVAWFPANDRLAMLEIAGAESRWTNGAQGDSLAIFSPASQKLYEPFASNGFLSFGYWQIFLGVHTPLIQKMSGLSSPDDLASWLKNGSNNARAAASILAEQGKEAWSTYNDGQYADYEIEARAALDAAYVSAKAAPETTIVAVSFDGTRIHLDHSNGSFQELTVKAAAYYSPWLRMEVDT